MQFHNNTLYKPIQQCNYEITFLKCTEFKTFRMYMMFTEYN